ncbi:sigma-70 RNA polymerase sigma factor region 4 domain-containing protein [Spirosoma areae]
MGTFNQSNRKQIAQESLRKASQLALYEQYGSMAYGLILQILPNNPEVAQTVLVDVFSSPELKALAEKSTRPAGELIRLVRANALEARQSTMASTPLPAKSLQATNDTTEKLVFDLSFCQGYTPDAIAESLQLSRPNVLKAIYSYFKHLRSS